MAPARGAAQPAQPFRPLDGVGKASPANGHNLPGCIGPALARAAFWRFIRRSRHMV